MNQIHMPQLRAQARGPTRAATASAVWRPGLLIAALVVGVGVLIGPLGPEGAACAFAAALSALALGALAWAFNRGAR